MATANNLPRILKRKDIIVLSDSLECPCGRTKERVHCPVCGKVRMYGLADTTPAIMSQNGDVIADCKTYRCLGCGEKFNDVDWYFNCHAPKKIDWEATKKLQQEKIKKYWEQRIFSGEKFDYNTRTKCISQCGLDPWEIRDLLIHAKHYKPSEKRAEGLEDKIKRLKDEVYNMEAYCKDHPEDADAIKDIEQKREEIKELEKP